LRPVEVREIPRHHVAVLELRRIGERLKKSAPHDLKTLLGARGTPGPIMVLVEHAADAKAFGPYLIGAIERIDKKSWRSVIIN
jgi:hypothetical protein